MENGNVNDYLKKCPETNRLQLVSKKKTSIITVSNILLQLLGVAKGLEYLHDESVIHGDLKGVSLFCV